MDRLTIWTKVMLRLTLVLLAIGVLPALVVQYVLTDLDALVPGMLLILVAPLGAICLVITVILSLAVLVRRLRGPS